MAEDHIVWPVGTTDEANRAIRGLAGCATLHIRHYGHRRQSDFFLRRPSDGRRTANRTLDHEGGRS
jgi:hypothetical protein